MLGAAAVGAETTIEANKTGVFYLKAHSVVALCLATTVSVYLATGLDVIKVAHVIQAESWRALGVRLAGKASTVKDTWSEQGLHTATKAIMNYLQETIERNLCEPGNSGH